MSICSNMAPIQELDFFCLTPDFTMHRDSIVRCGTNMMNSNLNQLYVAKPAKKGQRWLMVIYEV